MIESTVVDIAPAQAARALGAWLRDAPPIRAFLDAARVLHRDAPAQKTIRDIREHQTALRWQQGDPSAHAQAVTRLESKLQALPVFQAYHHAEQEARALCCAVDAVIGEAAGVAFAANAKRSCCGG